jgi:hypothetical protein
MTSSPPDRSPLDFRADVIHPVRKLLGRTIDVPKGPHWRAEEDGDGITLMLDIESDVLAHNIQATLDAAPSFLLCVAYWLEVESGRPVRCRVRVLGPPPADRSGLLHWRRSMLILDEYQRVLPRRFHVQSSEHWTWPASPLLNVSRSERKDGDVTLPPSVHRLELSICDTPRAASEFCVRIREFRRQLPVGLFDGQASNEQRWTPAGKSQIDLWAVSDDERTVHLFELKAVGNLPLGMLPEAFYYLRLLHHLRVGIGDTRLVEQRSAAHDAIRKASRLEMWLVAPAYHPLLLPELRQDLRLSPIDWLNEGMRDDGAVMRLLPLELTGDGEWKHWRCKDMRPHLPNEQRSE